jgi:FkbM family methyltransferase
MIGDSDRSFIEGMLARDGLRRYEPSTAPALLAAFEWFDDMTLFDVGANIGLYSLLAELVFEPREVIAFEPTPDLVDRAMMLAKLNDVDITLEPIALGSEPGTAELFRSARSDTSNSLVAGFRTATGSVEVEVDTVDQYVLRTGLVPTILKVDTELFDAEVLKGASATIETYRPWIFVEAIHTRGRDYGIGISAAMAEHGYSCYELGSRTPWVTQSKVTARAGTLEPDWLMTPQPVADSFWTRVGDWRAALEACGGAESGVPDQPIESHPTELARSAQESVRSFVAQIRRATGRSV